MSETTNGRAMNTTRDSFAATPTSEVHDGPLTEFADRGDPLGAGVEDVAEDVGAPTEGVDSFADELSKIAEQLRSENKAALTKYLDQCAGTHRAA